MNMQRPKASTELLMLLDRHSLIAEEDHQIVHQCVVQFLELLVAERFGEIDAVDLRADDGGKLAHFNRLIAHAVSSSCPVQD
jgi:hypothetical protein